MNCRKTGIRLFYVFFSAVCAHEFLWSKYNIYTVYNMRYNTNVGFLCTKRNKPKETYVQKEKTKRIDIKR